MMTKPSPEHINARNSLLGYVCGIGQEVPADANNYICDLINDPTVRLYFKQEPDLSSLTQEVREQNAIHFFLAYNNSQIKGGGLVKNRENRAAYRDIYNQIYHPKISEIIDATKFGEVLTKQRKSRGLLNRIFYKDVQAILSNLIRITDPAQGNGSLISSYCLRGSPNVRKTYLRFPLSL